MEQILIVNQNVTQGLALQSLLSQRPETADASVVVHSVEDAVSILHRFNPRLIFMNLEQEGIFDFFKNVDQKKVEVIALISDVWESALAARLLELDHLMAPYSPTALEKTLRKTNYRMGRV